MIHLFWILPVLHLFLVVHFVKEFP